MASPYCYIGFPVSLVTVARVRFEGPWISQRNLNFWGPPEGDSTLTTLQFEHGKCRSSLLKDFGRATSSKAFDHGICLKVAEVYTRPESGCRDAQPVVVVDLIPLDFSCYWFSGFIS